MGVYNGKMPRAIVHWSQRKISETRHTRYKQIIFKLYGPCQCCAENAPEFLTIDHIGGRTADQPRRFREIAREIINRGSMPPELRILCMNCNWSYGKWG